MVLIPFKFSVENFSALAGLEVKLGQTWSQHGPDMVPKIETPKRWALDNVNPVLKILVL